MHPSTNSNKSHSSAKQHSFKCKVRENQEVGRWKKSEHEDFIRGKFNREITGFPIKN